MDREIFRTLIAPREPEKIGRILLLLASGETLNRFDAERLGDHCLNSTVAELRNDYGLSSALRDEWEKVPCRMRFTTRVKRYRLDDTDGALEKTLQLLLTVWGYQLPDKKGPGGSSAPPPPPQDTRQLDFIGGA